MPSEPKPSPKTTARRMGVGQVERMLVLRTFPGFAELEPELVAVLAEHVKERSFARGAYIFREGVPVTSIHMIVEGRVELVRHGRFIRELGEKSAVGGVAAFSNDPDGYDVRAITDVVSLEMRIEDTIDIFEDHFPILRSVLRGVAREVLEARVALPGTAGFVEAETEDERPRPPNALDLVERMALIRKTLPFASSRLDAVADLARESTEVRLPKGERLWREGDAAHAMVLVVAGNLLCTSSRGHRFRFGPGDVVGSLDASAQRPRWFTAEVTRDLLGLEVRTETFYDVFEDNFDMAMDLLRGMTSGLMATYDLRARAESGAGG
jgi:CRP-like cAMP-binding protein